MSHEHYTKNTVQASAYCKPCGKFTMHRVDGGMLSACLNCIAKPLAPAEEKQPEQLTLMQVYGSIKV